MPVPAPCRSGISLVPHHQGEKCQKRSAKFLRYVTKFWGTFVLFFCPREIIFAMFSGICRHTTQTYHAKNHSSQCLINLLLLFEVVEQFVLGGETSEAMCEVSKVCYENMGNICLVVYGLGNFSFRCSLESADMPPRPIMPKIAVFSFL